MSELSKKDSDSDVNSNSSWTLLTEDAAGDDDRLTGKTEKQAEENVTTSLGKKENTPEIKENELATADVGKKPDEGDACSENDVESLSSASSSCSLDSLPEIRKQEGNVEQGCLTLDEYLNEKEVAHDYDYDDRAEFWEYLWNSNKRGKRKYKKYKAQNLTTMTVVGAVLSIAGISLLCMMAPFFKQQPVTADIQNKLEQNFTKIETPYANANDLKVYINKSDKATSLVNNIDVLDPIIQQCCNCHTSKKDCKACPKNTKANPKDVPIEKPVTYEEYLVEQSNKKENTATHPKETAKQKTTKNEKSFKTHEGKKLSSHQSKNIKTESEAKQKKEDSAEKKDKKQENEKCFEKPNKSRKTLDKENRNVKRKSSKKLEKINSKRKQDEVPASDIKQELLNSAKQQTQKIESNSKVKFTAPDTKKELLKSSKQPTQKIKSKSKVKFTEKQQDENKPNFVLVDKNTEAPGGLSNIIPKNIKKVLSALRKEPPKLQKQTFILPSKVTDNELVNAPDTVSSNSKSDDGFPSLKATVESDNTKQLQEPCATWVKNTTPVVTPNQTSDYAFFRTDFIACQLLQDLCLLRLTRKLNTKEKSKQKRLKRKLDRKRLRAAKVIVVDNESETAKTSPKVTPETKINANGTISKEVVFNNSVIKFTPKLVDNHFLSEQKSVKTDPVPPTNFDLLKELPFMRNDKIERRGSIMICGPTSSIADRPLGYKPQRQAPCAVISNNNNDKETPKVNLLKGSHNDIHVLRHQRLMICREIANQKSAKYLADTRRKNEERLKILEQMRLDNRMKIQAIIRERTDRLRKDAALGIYNVPLPDYKEVSEKLRLLKKKKDQVGFLIESVSSSDSEQEKDSPKCDESKISSELMTALKMGKKVSDTFREWTLKKAPTLTCLKNYCNSKVSQISERLTSQSLNQTNIKSTLNQEELETLKCRKEKHEQLKKFWKAKQEYLDKRIEICELLKKKLSEEDIQEKPDHCISQGVQILDSIINDVLKSVRSSKSFVDKSCRAEENIKKPSKSVGNIVVKNEQQEKPANKTRKETFSANSDELYNWLFERKGMEIRKRDNCLWNTARPGYVERKKEISSKQDPAKGFHEKIVKKHN